MFRFKLPKPEDLVNKWPLNYLEEHLTSPGLWTFRRHSTALGVAWGLFCSSLPMPFQMALCTVGCIIWCINLPLALAFVWVSNPITIPFLIYAAYIIGNYLFPTQGVEISPEDFKNLEWAVLWESISNKWVQVMTGCLILGTILAAIGYVVVQALWTLRIRLRHRGIQRVKRQIKNENNNDDYQPPD